jgi:hypothetical protein
MRPHTSLSPCSHAQARNAALGANQAMQYTLCAPTVYGNDADLVMTEINSMMGAKGIDDEVRHRRGRWWLRENGWWSSRPLARDVAMRARHQLAVHADDSILTTQPSL